MARESRKREVCCLMARYSDENFAPCLQQTLHLVTFWVHLSLLHYFTLHQPPTNAPFVAASVNLSLCTMLATNSSLLQIWLVHPSWLQQSFVLPCTKQTPPFLALEVRSVRSSLLQALTITFVLFGLIWSTPHGCIASPLHHTC